MGNSDSRRRAARARQNLIRSKAVPIENGGAVRPRFVADVMLGRLSKWLRIAGFDVLYSNSFDDDELVALSRRENRVLLSRDTRLLVRRAVKQFIFLESEDIRAQIRQVFRETHTGDLPGLLTRCLTCNEVLHEIERESVRATVPPFVYQTQSRFKQCPLCRKVYWAGTHRQAVLRTLQVLIDGSTEETC